MMRRFFRVAPSLFNGLGGVALVTVTGSAPVPTYAYVTNVFSHGVSVIETAGNTVVATIAAGSGPIGVAITP